MGIIFDILLLLGAGFLGFLSLKPLKESADYRFTKVKELLKGVFYLGTAGVAILFWSWWAILIGVPIAYLIEKMDGNGENKLLDR